MNIWTFTATVIKPPESRYTQSGKQVVDIKVEIPAENYEGSKPSRVSASAFGKLAEQAMQLTVGTRVLFVGRPNSGKPYEYQGKWYSQLCCFINSFESLETSAPATPAQPTLPETSEQKPSVKPKSVQPGMNIGSDDDVPF